MRLFLWFYLWVFGPSLNQNYFLMKTLIVDDSKLATIDYREMLSVNGGVASTQEAFNAGYEFGAYVSKIIGGARMMKWIFGFF